MAPLRVSTTKSEWLPDDPTAFVPTRLWKLPFITTWDDSRNQNRPTDSAEEAQIRGGVPEGLRVGDGSAHRDRPLFPVLQQRATAPESWLPDAGSDPPGGVTFMNGATKRKSAFLESGTLSPNPWDLTPLGRNVWCTVEGTRTEDRAPQGCD